MVDTTQKLCHVDTAVLVVGAEPVKTLLKAGVLSDDGLILLAVVHVHAEGWPSSPWLDPVAWC